MPLCVKDKFRYLGKSDSFNIMTLASIDCSFYDNEDAYRKIENLMKLAGLPMNFTVCRAENIENAYATMDSNGTRFIVYDDAFLRKLDSDSSRLETITALAHEIGHHLSAHTLSINFENFEPIYKRYCAKDSPSYNINKCNEEILKYYKLSRDQELEADRFAGYIMYKYGASLNQILNLYTKIANNNNDTLSDHPSLIKRLNAVKAGYELAEANTKINVQKIDLEEIKGSKINFVINNLSRIERNRLISKIKSFATWEAMKYVKDNSKYSFGTGGRSLTLEEEKSIIKYHGQKDKYWLIDNDSLYFESIIQFLVLDDDNRLQYGPVTGIEIKDGILKLLVFNEYEKPKVVYSSPFEEKQISFEEIKTIFIQIYKNGIQKAIDKYYH